MTKYSDQPTSKKQLDLMQNLKKSVQNLERYLLKYEQQVKEKQQIWLEKIATEIALIKETASSMKKEVRLVVDRLVKHWPIFLQNRTEDNFAIICQEVAAIYESLLH